MKNLSESLPVGRAKPIACFLSQLSHASMIKSFASLHFISPRVLLCPSDQMLDDRAQFHKKVKLPEGKIMIDAPMEQHCLFSHHLDPTGHIHCTASNVGRATPGVSDRRPGP
jgi:hypothetical protein